MVLVLLLLVLLVVLLEDGACEEEGAPSDFRLSDGADLDAKAISLLVVVADLVASIATVAVVVFFGVSGEEGLVRAAMAARFNEFDVDKSYESLGVVSYTFFYHLSSRRSA